MNLQHFAVNELRRRGDAAVQRLRPRARGPAQQLAPHLHGLQPPRPLQLRRALLRARARRAHRFAAWTVSCYAAAVAFVAAQIDYPLSI